MLDIENVDAAAILVTADLPDEARLALLDLDPTEAAMHGKVLGWDVEGQQWVPVEAPVTQVSPPPSAHGLGSDRSRQPNRSQAHRSRTGCGR